MRCVDTYFRGHCAPFRIPPLVYQAVKEICQDIQDNVHDGDCYQLHISPLIWMASSMIVMKLDRNTYRVATIKSESVSGTFHEM